ncbi:c-type cytochrome [Rhodoferax sp. AJA081-3]|uniref:c-type cytochrome n=1 Tax=Rhodoferax sp. AJA081-3 TaxID=2752316 RepID=UPI001ADF0015|nr:c-type cytochrome [Rhodoferax sp. AJA081-3]QTN26697.1 c-type cytochrome [Rhodoferax sp. AJA081-3]
MPIHIPTLGRAALLALSLLWAPVQAADTSPTTPRTVPDTIAQRVLACTGCHGKEGRSTNAGYFPRIAGKPAAYLYNQLRNFRDGRRTNAAMTHLVDPLSDAYLREIANYFASQDLPYPPPQTANAPAAVLQQARTLVLQGDASRKIPACTHCHGSAMTGVLPAFPGLLGLPRDYLVGQLGAWQTNKRHAVAPDCMGSIAKRLTADEISAIATWLSSQALPAQTHAVAANTRPLPVDCGSGLQ